MKKIAKLGMRFFAGLLLSLTLMPQDTSASELLGVWLTKQGKSRVNVAPCYSNQICADIIWLRDPLGSNGKPKVDRNNEVVSARSRKVMGIRVLRVSQTGANQWQGLGYDPESGRQFRATVSLDRSKSNLNIRGCATVLITEVCRTSGWKKISGPSAPAQIQANPSAAPLPPLTRQGAQPANRQRLRPYPPR